MKEETFTKRNNYIPGKSEIRIKIAQKGAKLKGRRQREMKGMMDGEWRREEMDSAGILI
jgi:hypothetical protein